MTAVCTSDGPQFEKNENDDSTYAAGRLRSEETI